MQKVLFLSILTLFLFGCQSETASEMQVTENGSYEYQIHVSNDGNLAQVGDVVSFHAQMRKQDSLVFSTHIQGQEQNLPIRDAVPGSRSSPVEEVLKLMHVGDSATVLMRIDTLPNQPRGFENEKYVYYDVVLTGIKTKEQVQAEQQAAQARAGEVATMVSQRISDYTAGKLNSEIQSTASGLKYIIHEPGSGEQAVAGRKVSVAYYGALTDGNRFDDSFSRGEPIEFPLGRGAVIKGWDEGLALLKEGGKATFFIPSDLGYGAAGSPPVIPGGAELVFYVELEKVN